MEELKSIIFAFISGGIVTTATWLYIFKNPEKVEKWIAMIFGWLSKIWQGAGYIATKHDIQSKINSFVNKINSDSTTQFPKISIQWAGKKGEEIIWEENEVILIIRDQKHKVKNFVNASQFFVSEALLKKAKRHLSKNQKISLDLFATKKILEDQNVVALEHFMADYFVPSLDKEEKVREIIKKLMNIDRLGIFFPILIQEIIFLGNKFFLDKPDNEIMTEVNELIDFLEQFSQRESGSADTPDSFRGKYMRSCIRIVASKTMRERGDVTKHKENICCAIKDGFANIYVIGRSDDGNKLFIEDVVNSVLDENSFIQLIKNYQYGGQIKMNGEYKKVKTYLTHLHNPSAVKYLIKTD